VDLISSLQSFVRVAETGSFSAVAAERGVTQPAISRQVTALEEYLCARLVQRSTQAVTLTEEGRNLLLPAQELIDAADGIRQLTGQWSRKPAGMVRVALPVSIGLYLSDRISQLLSEFDALSIDLVLRDRCGNLVEEGLDLEVCVGEPQDALLICRRVGSMADVLAASPAYLKENLSPRHPSDLEKHDCIVHYRSGSTRGWHFIDSTTGAECYVAPRGRFSADNAAAAYRAAVGGQGISCLPAVLVADDIASGRLCQVLPQFHLRRHPIYITYASRRRLPHRTRAVIDFLVRSFQSDPQMRIPE
jgi:DNA-binding transcriptional LysR family regulator